MFLIYYFKYLLHVPRICGTYIMGTASQEIPGLWATMEPYGDNSFSRKNQNQGYSLDCGGPGVAVETVEVAIEPDLLFNIIYIIRSCLCPR